MTGTEGPEHDPALSEGREVIREEPASGVGDSAPARLPTLHLDEHDPVAGHPEEVGAELVELLGDAVPFGRVDPADDLEVRLLPAEGREPLASA